MQRKHQLVREWLDRARQDLRSAEVLLDADPPLLQDAAFHCQQTVEKAIKGFLSHHDWRFERTHVMRYLIDPCVDLDGDFARWRDAAESMTDYAVQMRYPMPPRAVTEQECGTL